MKIGFCSNSMEYVDEHFGRAKQILIYNITEEKYELEEVRMIAEVDGSKEHKNDTQAKAKALSDCSILYMREIGGPAAAAVVKNNIHPIKTSENILIERILSDLKERLGNNPPPWLKKILYKDKDL